MFGKMSGQIQRLVTHSGTLTSVLRIWNKLVEVAALSESIEWKNAAWRLKMARVKLATTVPVCGGSHVFCSNHKVTDGR
jgi:chorismate-pyruvate lyase